MRPQNGEFVMTEVIDGKRVAEDVVSKVKALTSELSAKGSAKPGLAVVIVGEDPASQVYVASKSRTAKECGFHSLQHTLPADTTEEQLLKIIGDLNADKSIHGILVQLPLPGHIDAGKVIQTIAPEKDVDGFHFINVGKLGTGELETAFVPCTPAGSMLLIERVRGKDLSGLNAVVVGRSNIVGKPMANLLLAANCTVTIAHSRTKDLPALARTADILVAAVGRPEMVKGDWVKPGATVIDVGINRIPAPEKGEGKSRLVGDVAYAEAAKVAGAITPVPGGVGPMTIAMLMANTVASAYLAAGLKRPSF
jgi:methylenetetrahydrofolate dehydrogenase (NADP+)/methenyltetrahydrofolate cyclohydrolase